MANGTDVNTVQLPVKDANGNPVPGFDVTFTVTNSVLLVTPPTSASTFTLPALSLVTGRVAIPFSSVVTVC
ncbi:Ig-like domain-containing protein [Serratia fonticola]